MEIGASVACRRPRLCIHSASRQRYCSGWATIEAVCGGGSDLAGQWIGLPRQNTAVGTDNIVFVTRARRDTWNEQFPNPGAMAYPHRMTPAIPGIEIADDCDALGIRRPNRKAHAIDAADRDALRAEGARQFEMPPLVEQMQIKFAQAANRRNTDPRSLGPHSATRYGADTACARAPGLRTVHIQPQASSGASRLPSARNTSTLSAPGRKARMIAATFEAVRSKHGKRIFVCGAAQRVHADCRSRRHDSCKPTSAMAASDFALDDSRHQRRQTRQRNADPGRSIGALITHFVSRLFDEEEIEQHPRGRSRSSDSSPPNSHAEKRPRPAGGIGRRACRARFRRPA